MADTAAHANAADALALAAEVLECARYGEDEDLAKYLGDGVTPDYAGGGGNTPLHMACANGHVECVRLLISHGAKYANNDSGNSPMHWAVLNKHLEIVNMLVDTYPEIDVLAKNSFGKSVLTESFGAGIAEVTSVILEHTSAAALEPKKKPGQTPSDSEGVEGVYKGTADALDKAEDSNVVQEYTYKLNFSSEAVAGPDIHAREIAIDWTGEVFSSHKTAADDTTGMQVWACSLIFSRWVVSLQAADPALFTDKMVVELGAGTGVPGITTLLYTGAKHVTFTDLFKHTMDNLRFNVEANVDASAHRTRADTDVCVYDWVKYTTLEAGSLDVILGSDLVYDAAAADLLTVVVKYLLKVTGTFLMVAGEGRQGVPELQAKLEAGGFTTTKEPTPQGFVANPLVSKDDAELQLHFNELEDNKFFLYTFRLADPSTALAPGTTVEVFGLTSKDGKAFNGRVGVHRGEVKPGRVAVLLEGTSKSMSVRIENLRRAGPKKNTNAGKGKDKEAQAYTRQVIRGNYSPTGAVYGPSARCSAKAQAMAAKL